MKREVKCEQCGWWWHHPREPIHFASWDEWAEDHPEKESLTCPNCGAVTDVSEKTTRFAKVSDETSAPPGVSDETPGFTHHAAVKKGAHKKTGGKKGK